MQQRLSISDLWNVLQRDRFYSDENSVHEVIKKLKYEYLKQPFTFNLNYELVGKGYTSFPALNLIFVLCGLCRLNTYQPDKDDPTDWFGQKFADRCKKLDLEIDRDELKDLLHRLELPLPKAWFPDAPISHVSLLEKSIKKRKRRYYREREKARKIAQEIWKAKPDRPMTWIIRHRLKKEVLRPDGRSFSEKAYRRWIKDLRPGYKGKNTPHN